MRAPLTQRHVCIVTETYSPEINGVALTLAHLVEGLRLQGHAVSVVRPRQRHFDGLVPHDDGNVALVGGLPLPGYNGLQVGLPASGVLQRRWARHRPDVVYVATEGPLGWSAVHAARRMGIHVLSGFHTNFHTYLRHYRVGWLRSLILRYLCWFHNRTFGTIVASVDLRDRLQTMGVKNVRVLGRGVDSRLFDPRRRSRRLRRTWGAADKDLVVLYVGRIAPEKNLELAIDAYDAMQRSNKSTIFVMVGDGPVRATLQQHHPDITFCGVQTGKELARHYASADVFLFPSETDTFGNVTLEAMASGLAVVAYDYAAAHLHIRNGETGILVPFGDRQTFVEAAASIAGDPSSLRAIRSGAREYATSLNWRRVAERFATLMGVPEQNGRVHVADASDAMGVTPACS